MPTFVIQEHRYEQQTHWDFMLEEGGRLATWQVAISPDRWTDEPLPCKKIADHRMIYLAYEGPISDDRGTVHIVDKGLYEPILITSKQWQIQAHGDIIHGRVDLNLIENDRWQLDFRSQIGRDQGDDR